MDTTNKAPRYLKRCVVSAAALALAVAVAAVVPTSTAQAASGRTLIPPRTAAGGYYWDFCKDNGTRTVRMFLELNPTCGGSGVVGWVAVTTNSATSHPVEVCDYLAGFGFGIRVDKANPDGSDSGHVYPYSTDVNHCYKNTLTYPIRKFRAVEDPYYFPAASPWRAPA